MSRSITEADVRAFVQEAHAHFNSGNAALMQGDIARGFRSAEDVAMRRRMSSGREYLEFLQMWAAVGGQITDERIQSVRQLPDETWEVIGSFTGGGTVKDGAPFGTPGRRFAETVSETLIIGEEDGRPKIVADTINYNADSLMKQIGVTAAQMAEASR